MNPYAPIIGLLALAAGFIVLSVTLSIFVGPARYNKAQSRVFLRAQSFLTAQMRW